MCMFSSDIPLSSADFTIYTPGIGTLYLTVIKTSLSFHNTMYMQCCANFMEKLHIILMSEEKSLWNNSANIILRSDKYPHERDL